jgi:TfoX/Sxy family transcriptional regulator of competence genes
MKMPKPDPQAMELFEGLLPAGPAVKVKPMFGNLGAFANGTMFMGVFGEHVFVRLSQSDRADALSIRGAATFAPMGGRPMKEYVVLPTSTLRDAKKAVAWIQKSLDYASTLTPVAKPRARSGRPTKVQTKRESKPQ